MLTACGAYDMAAIGHMEVIARLPYPRAFSHLHSRTITCQDKTQELAHAAPSKESSIHGRPESFRASPLDPSAESSHN
jgi:hypothetical protein